MRSCIGFSCVLSFIRQTQVKLKTLGSVFVHELNSSQTQQIEIVFVHALLHWFLVVYCILVKLKSNLKQLSLYLFLSFFIENWIFGLNSNQTQQLEFVFVHVILHLHLVVYWILVKLESNLQHFWVYINSFLLYWKLNCWKTQVKSSIFWVWLCVCFLRLVSNWRLSCWTTQVKSKIFEFDFVHACSAWFPLENWIVEKLKSDPKYLRFTLYMRSPLGFPLNNELLNNSIQIQNLWVWLCTSVLRLVSNWKLNCRKNACQIQNIWVWLSTCVLRFVSSWKFNLNNSSQIQNIWVWLCTFVLRLVSRWKLNCWTTQVKSNILEFDFADAFSAWFPVEQWFFEKLKSNPKYLSLTLYMRSPPGFQLKIELLKNSSEIQHIWDWLCTCPSESDLFMTF